MNIHEHEPMAEGDIQNNPNLNLETLAVENILLYPPFDTTVLKYDIEIPNEMDKLNILAIPENEESRVEIIGNSNLKEGQNKITIIVTTINGETREYIINGYRRNVAEEEEYAEKKEAELQQLEEIYETYQTYSTRRLSIDRTTAETRTVKENKPKKTENRSYSGVIVAVIIIALVVLAYCILRQKRKK